LKGLVWSILLVAPFGAVADEVYRTVDENGVVRFSDLPSDNAERVVVNVPQPTSSPTASTVPAEPRSTPQTLTAEMPRPPTTEELAADRERNCASARQMVETYATSRRLFRTLPDGEREYLSSEEIDEARARAEANVAAWCD